MPEESNKEINTDRKFSDEINDDKTSSDEMGGDETTNDEMDEETTDQADAEQMGKFFSPVFLIEAIIMFPIAIILDLIGVILLFFALDDFWITDLIGLIIIGGWMFFRSGQVTVSKKAGKTIKKTGKKLLKRLGLTFLGEIIPYFGGIAPCWTLAVFFELKNN